MALRTLALLLLSFLPALAWPNGYTYKYVWTIQSGKVPATQSSFPLLACPNALGHGCDLAVGALAGEFTNSSCFDAIWTSDSAGTTALPFELVPNSCTAASGIAEWWFAPTSVTAGMSVYLWVGNSGVTTNQGWPTAGSSPWDANFAQVYHLGGGGTLNVNDSTVNAANGTNNSATAATGQASGGASFVSASSQWISFTNVVTSGEQITMSAWIKLSSLTQPAIIWDNRKTSTLEGCVLYVNNSNSHPFLSCQNISQIGGAASLVDSAWHMVTGVLNSDGSTWIYVDGSQQTSQGATGGFTGFLSTIARMGKSGDSSPVFVNGLEDEVHVSKTNRSANWLAMEFNNQSSQTAFWSVSGPNVTTAVARHVVSQHGVGNNLGALSIAPVLTAGFGNSRLNAQTAEAILTPAIVSDNTKFGVQCTIVPPDGGWIYHQVLIAQSAGKNLLIGATMGGNSGGGDHLYAWLEGSCSSTPVWSQSFGSPWTAYPSSPIFYTNAIGILSTPVIDQVNGWIFLVSYSGGSSGTPTIQLNKVRLSDGVILAQSSISSATVSAPGVGCINGQTAQSCGGQSDTTSGGNFLFYAPSEDQRDALLLVSGNVYFGFGAGDEGHNWHGWFLSYDEATLTQQAVYVTTSGNGIATGANGGGIWPPGSGCSSDGTYIYCPGGNGTSDLSTGGPDAGQSLIKLSLALALVDYTTPGDVVATNAADADVNCVPMLLDGTHVACGYKNGCGWIITTASMGHLAAMATTQPTGCSADTGNAQQVWQIQSITPSNSSGVYGGAFCNGALYYPIKSGPLRGFAYSAGTVTTTPFATGVNNYATMNVSCSSNGASSTIVWAATATSSPFSTAQNVKLVAFNPSTLVEMNSWTSIGHISKWAQPTIDGAGRVFVPTDAGIVQLGIL